MQFLAPIWPPTSLNHAVCFLAKSHQFLQRFLGTVLFARGCIGKMLCSKVLIDPLRLCYRLPRESLSTSHTSLLLARCLWLRNRTPDPERRFHLGCSAPRILADLQIGLWFLSWPFGPHCLKKTATNSNRFLRNMGLVWQWMLICSMCPGLCWVAFSISILEARLC